MHVRFSWDPAKAASNAAKHGVTFKEAITVFDDLGIHIELQRHANEIRLSATGYSSNHRLLVV
ncbi:MAG TPA: BrnT family toxin, partial [Polyangiaceae bacterium]|nr:BrnT family toxin [Polyangiaceae bacterium]